MNAQNLIVHEIGIFNHLGVQKLMMCEIRQISFQTGIRWYSLIISTSIILSYILSC